MATNVVAGQTYTFSTDRTGWTESIGYYECWVDVSFKIDSVDPVNNTTTLSFTGTFRSTNKNWGRGVRVARLTVCNSTTASDTTGTPNPAYYFSYGSANIVYDGEAVYNSNNSSYKLKDIKVVIPHGEGTTKTIYINAQFAFGQSTYNSTSYNNAYTLPAIDRNHMVYVRDGSQWKKGKIYVHNGSQWVTPAVGASSNRGVYIWNGSEWKLGTARG